MMDPALKIVKEGLVEELYRRYKFMTRNTNSTEFVFSIDEIRKPGMEGLNGHISIEFFLRFRIMKAI
jgi:hypothetical protein